MVFFVQPPQAEGGDVPNPTYMLSFVSNYIQYVSLLYHVFKAYVIEKYVSLPFCLKPCYYPPMFLCYSVFKAHVLLSYTKAPPR